MSTRAGSYLHRLVPALVAGLTVWACLLSWSPLLAEPKHVLPLLGVVVAVGVTGATARWCGLPTLGVALLHLLVAGTLCLTLTTGSLVPTPDSWQVLRETLAQGVESARTFSAPVPADAPPVWPLFLVVGTVGAVVLDLLALSRRWVAVSALVLLALHLVPANLAVEAPWWSFLVVVVGFLTLLHLDADDLVLRWGNGREAPGELRDGAATDSRPRPRPSRNLGAALRIGAAAVVGAMVVSTVLGATVPHSVRSWTPGGTSGTQVTLTSPLVDMRRDLDRGAVIDLLVVESERRPTYVRHAVLPKFDGAEWSTGDRSATALPRNGDDLPLTGVDPLLRRTERRYDFTATYAFRSRWLPLVSQSVRIDAEGDWRWDRDTSDVAAFEPTLTTGGASWSVVAADLEYSQERLADAPSGVNEVPRIFSELPPDLPRSVRRWADEVTADESTRFGKALALQSWFRSEFDYSLDQVETVDNDALVEFLSPQGRVGYCEQFAAAMAVMARTLGIPSRVAVGFLEPRRVGVQKWEFTSYDLHAWPELYFPGSGWVRFEPTPASRASGVPEYTEQRQEPPSVPSPSASSTPEPSAPTPSVQEPRTAPEREVVTRDEESGLPWRTVVGWALGLLVLAAVVLTPQWLRQRRRTARLREDDVELWWAELRDSAVDLGRPWPEGRSPRATGATLLDWVNDPDVATDHRVTSHVEHLVAAVEEERFARPVRDGGTRVRPASPADVRAVLDALSGQGTRRTRWQARWLPVSLLRRLGRD